MVRGRPLYGLMTIRFGGNWRIDLYGQEALESERLVAAGRPKTKMLLAGQWVNVVRNPGLHARNQYVPEIYQHQEHLNRYHRKDAVWGFYEPGQYLGCPRKGHSGCLDQYSGDGNIQFKENCVWNDSTGPRQWIRAVFLQVFAEEVAGLSRAVSKTERRRRELWGSRRMLRPPPVFLWLKCKWIELFLVAAVRDSSCSLQLVVFQVFWTETWPYFT